LKQVFIKLVLFQQGYDKTNFDINEKFVNN